MPPYHHLLHNSSTLTLPQLKQIHTHLLTAPFPSLFQSLIRSAIASGHLTYANLLLLHHHHQPPPPAHLWNILIQSLSKSPHSHHCLHLFRRMLDTGSSIPDKYTFTFVVASCSHEPTSEAGEAVHCQAVKTGYQSDLYVGNSLINTYSVFGKTGCARRVFDEMPVRDVVSWTSLMKGHATIGELELARKLFNKMPNPNAVSWAVMISGYVGVEKYTDALNLFNDVLYRDKKEQPNEAVLVCVLSACARIGALDQGKWIHTYINKIKLPKSNNINTALIDMYSRCGRIECAKQVFCDSSARDLLTWTSMISGLALHGLGNDAVSVFWQMIADGLRPDGITVLGVLNACSHSGLLNEGHEIFYSMSCLWGITPKIEHYGCLIDLLGRAGQIQKAVGVVMKMPLEPDIVIWRALLSSCRTHHNMELGQRIIDHIARLDLSKQGGGHLLLSNLYASIGRWDEVARVRNNMGEDSKGSSPGCSWIEVNGTVHEFLAADRLHPKIVEIQNKLSEVMRVVSLKGGYIVNTKQVLFDLSEEDREQAVYWHSEKLAVAFGLMSLEAGCSIQIVKNLRICEDCHSAMKAISHVFKREIVVRDRARFHTFTDGRCSCLDYW